MSFSKLYQDSTWRSGFNDLSLDGSMVNVDLDSISGWDTKITSTASFENISKTIEVMLRLPLELGETAIFTTDTVEKVVVKDSKDGDPIDALIVMNAPEMVPFDTTSMINLARSQGNILIGDQSFNKDWPIGSNSFYADSVNKIPNVTYIDGNLSIGGSCTLFGIFIIKSNIIFEARGNPSVVGILYLPDGGEVIFDGGGDPKKPDVYGGIVCDGKVWATPKSDKVWVKYEKEYMKLFSNYQLSKNLYILSWTESHYY